MKYNKPISLWLFFFSFFSTAFSWVMVVGYRLFGEEFNLNAHFGHICVGGVFYATGMLLAMHFSGALNKIITS